MVSRFLLKMRLLDHIYDNMVVEKVTTRIVLPELARWAFFIVNCACISLCECSTDLSSAVGKTYYYSEIKLIAPYDVSRLADEQHATYLDWGEGRPVVVLQKESLVDAHIQPFVLKYNWQRSFLW